MKNFTDKHNNAGTESGKWLRGRFITVFVLALILTVFLITLLSLYPNMPVLTRLAENFSGYNAIYPPFRGDENVYFEIAKNLLSGNLYEKDSPERSYSVGYSILAAPFIAVLGKIGGYVANVFIVWGCLVVFYLIVRRYGSRVKALVLTIIMAFATLNWFYAVSYYTEPLAQLLVILGFYLLTVNRGSPRWGIAITLAGVVTALNLFVRPHYILITVPFFLYLWIDIQKKFVFDKRAFLFAGGATIIVVLFLMRNFFVFGGPFTFEYTRHIADYVPGTASQYMKGNIFLGTHRLLFDQYHGLFTITPIFLIFPAGLRSMWLKGMKKESLLLLASVVIMALFAAASTYPFTEFGLGSRHMVPVLPLMLFPAVFFLNGKLFSSSVITILALYSFYHAGFGWFTGGEPGSGFFLGILNDSQSRAIILARKDLLPKKEFDSEEDLINTYLKALEKTDMMNFLQTLDPSVIDRIEGNERTFMLHLRSQENPKSFILKADPKRGIIFKSFTISD